MIYDEKHNTVCHAVVDKVSVLIVLPLEGEEEHVNPLILPVLPLEWRARMKWLS